MPKIILATLAMLGPCLDLAGAFLLSAYIVAGSENIDKILDDLKKFSHNKLVIASRFFYRGERSIESFLTAPIAETPGFAALHWLLYPFVFILLLVAPLVFFPVVSVGSSTILLFVFSLLFSPKIVRNSRIRWFLYVLATTVFLATVIHYFSLSVAAKILITPLLTLGIAMFFIAIPLGFVFLVRWVVDKEQEKRVSLIGLFLLASGFIIQGVYNVSTLY